MNHKQYKDAFSFVRPSESFMEQTRLRIREQIGTARPKSKWTNWQIPAALMACAITALLVTILTKPVGFPTETSPPESTRATTATTQTGVRQLVLDGSPVQLSELVFAPGAAIRLPDRLDIGQSMVDSIAPRNYVSDLSDSANLIVKATVIDVRFNAYPLKLQVREEDYKAFLTEEENQYQLMTVHSVIHRIRIDKIYYAGESEIKAGDELVLENIIEASDVGSPGSILKTCHQYILPITQTDGSVLSEALHSDYEAVIGATDTESKHALLFTRTPQIELTLNGGVIFFARRDMPGVEQGAGWVDLINDNTVPVEIDIPLNPFELYESEEASWLYRDHMKLRADKAFEGDFQDLVDGIYGLSRP